MMMMMMMMMIMMMMMMMMMMMIMMKKKKKKKKRRRRRKEEEEETFKYKDIQCVSDMVISARAIVCSCPRGYNDGQFLTSEFSCCVIIMLVRLTVRSRLCIVACYCAYALLGCLL